MEAFTIRHINFAYPDAEDYALCDVSLSVRKGEFFTLCGPSGGGKTTLLRLLKPMLAPSGTLSGELWFDAKELSALTQCEQCERIGFVQQSPEHQIVTDKVWHELAFGLESFGLAPDAIRRRVAEIAEFFAISDWLYHDTASLSGGQKQVLNLAAAMVTQPDALLLDEPTSQLDPVAASKFFSLLQKINRELGTTVILSEQRLEEALPLSDRAAVLCKGKLLCIGTPRQIGNELRDRADAMLAAMPTAMRVWAAVGGAECPVSVREGREWLISAVRVRCVPPQSSADTGAEEAIITVKGAWFRYEKEAPDILRDLSMELQRGEMLALLGGNGAGKSTTLKLIAGLDRPQRGTVTVRGRTALLAQDVQTMFVKATLRDELCSVSDKSDALQRVIGLCRLSDLLSRHPYDLSGGEQQRAALAKVLLTSPDILLLDEPTKGLDAPFKAELAAILQSLRQEGMSILMVSHDVEFCAQCASRCALFFDGAVVSQGTPREFFSGSGFYATAAGRMARGIVDGAVTAEDLIAACGAEPCLNKTPPQTQRAPREGEAKADAAAACKRGDSADASPKAVWTVLALALLAALTVLGGMYLFGSRKYYFTSMLLLLEGMLPFFIALEKRRLHAREVVTLAVLCALGVAGRAAFFMLPQCKPVMALSVLSGASLGAEAGFLVGAVTMLVSNIMFSQGPWTPWQMFAMGLAGLLAGLLFRRRESRTKLRLCVFGAASSVLLYGFIMNSASALMWVQQLDLALLLPYYLSGFPMDCVQAAATAAFLWLFAEPMLEKLERVKKKYLSPVQE